MHRVGPRRLRTRIPAWGWRAVLVRTILLASGWWILCEGAPGGWVFGVPVIIAALAASLALPAPGAPRWSLRGLVRFAVVFGVESVRGGVDVARRALAPRLPLSPTVVSYHLRLPPGPARTLFLGTLSLMPGTLALGEAQWTLELHVLAPSDTLWHELGRIERSITHATGVPLEELDG